MDTQSYEFFVEEIFDSKTVRRVAEIWRDQPGGKKSRYCGPAETIFDQPSQLPTRQVWYVSGMITRDEDHGPAIIEYAPGTENITRIEYWHHNQCHRFGGLPAIVEYDPIGGEVISQKFFEFGNPIIPSGSTEDATDKPTP